MSVSTPLIIVYSLLEIVALIVIVRLWMRRRAKFWPSILWSFVLLVPFFGLMVYLFLHEEPDRHPYMTGDGGWNVGGDGHGSGDSGGGHGGH
jgi:hypothetical protein